MFASACTRLTAEQRAELARSRQIEAQNKFDYSQHLAGKIKLLLLGTGESGKTTIFKQVTQLYGPGWPDNHFLSYQPMIYGNINSQMAQVLRAAEALKVTVPQLDPNGYLAEEQTRMQLAAEAKERLLALDFDTQSTVTAKAAAMLRALWRDPGVRDLWARRNLFQVWDCLEYYMDNIERIGVGSNKYFPNLDDVLQCRVRTAGVREVDFSFPNQPTRYVMFDVGGQRAERKKWIGCFDQVAAVVFVAAMNEFDQTLYEDDRVNRMDETLIVWSDMVNEKNLANAGFLLFLNKMDLFRKKLLTHKFRNAEMNQNVDFDGREPCEIVAEFRGNAAASERVLEAAVMDCANFLKAKFENVVQARVKGGSSSIHFVTAIDQDVVREVFKKCGETILRRTIYASGLPLGP